MNSTNDTNQLNKKIKQAVGFKNQEEKDDFRTEAIHLDIIANVRALMERKKISKADLAKQLNTSKSYITQLFTGDKLLNLKTLVKFERILDSKVEINFKTLSEIFSEGNIYPFPIKFIAYTDIDDFEKGGNVLVAGENYNEINQDVQVA